MRYVHAGLTERHLRYWPLAVTTTCTRCSGKGGWYQDPEHDVPCDDCEGTGYHISPLRATARRRERMTPSLPIIRRIAA